MTKYALTKVCSIGPIEELFARSGRQLSDVFALAEIPLDVLQDRDLLITMRDQCRLLDIVARETGDCSFAAKLAVIGGSRWLGNFGRWVHQGETLGDAIERANDSIGHLLQSGSRLRCETSSKWVSWSYETPGLQEQGRVHHHLLALGYMLDLVRSYAPLNPGVLRAEVQAAGLGGRAVVESLYQCDVRAGAGTVLVFPAEALECQHRRAQDSLVNEAAGSIRPDRDCQASDVVGAVDALIDIARLESYPKLNWVARRLECSPRTLQRALAREGQTFEVMVERVLSRKAKQLLSSAPVSVTEVAFQLGYSDVAHFSRAFKTWTGVAPLHFRKSNGDHDDVVPSRASVGLGRC